MAKEKEKRASVVDCVNFTIKFMLSAVLHHMIACSILKLKVADSNDILHLGVTLVKTPPLVVECAVSVFQEEWLIAITGDTWTQCSLPPYIHPFPITHHLVLIRVAGPVLPFMIYTPHHWFSSEKGEVWRMLLSVLHMHGFLIFLFSFLALNIAHTILHTLKHSDITD